MTIQAKTRCKHQYDGINLKCPYGCHGDNINHIKREKKVIKPWVPYRITPPNTECIGQVYGKLTVTEWIVASKGKVKCKCSCGNECIRFLRTLQETPDIQCCDGCKDNSDPNIGKVFGRLTIKERLHDIDYYKCECSCGNVYNRRISDIKRSLKTGNEPMCRACYNKLSTFEPLTGWKVRE